MSLRTKFIAAALGTLVVVMTVGALYLNHSQARSFEDEARTRSEMVVNFAQASRAYVKKVLRPTIESHTDEMVFEAMSSTFVTRSIFEQFHETMPQYSYRQPTLNPLNLDNKADDFEARLIKNFDDDRDLKEVSGFRTMGGAEQFYVARPIIVEAACLKCHNTPETAPAAVVERYGREHGYNWREGQVAATMMVSVPTTDLRAAQASVMTVLLGTFAVLTAIMLGLIYILFDRLVLRRVHAVADVMKQVGAEPNADSRVRDNSTDEIGTLARVFDHMADNIQTSRIELEKSLLFSRAITDTAPDGIITITDRGVIESINRAAETIFGYSADEAIGENVCLLMPSPHGEQHEEYLARYWRTSEAATIGTAQEMVGQRKDGTTFPLDITASEMSLGDQRMFVGIVRDTTVRKSVEQKNNQLAQAVEAVVEAVVLTDRAGRILQANPAFTKITGYSAAEAVGKTLALVKSSQHPSEFYRDMWRTILTGRVWSGRVINRRKDGSLYNAALTIAPIHDGSEEVVGFVGVQRDVTQDIEREEALADALRRSEQASRTKSEFLANMSHEIRTPMTAILGFTDILLENVQRPENIEAIKTIKNNGAYLLQLINDILDLSKIEAGKLEVEIVECDPHRIISEVACLLRPRAAGKNVELSVDYVGAIPATIRTDSTRFKQCVINLAGNAVKFTEHGSVTIKIGISGSQSDPQLHVAVVDTGIGIPQDRLELVFQPFVQADNSTTRRFGGSGLGLTITRRVAELLGGSLEACSEVGKGSVFTLCIPTGPLDSVRLLEQPVEEAGSRFEAQQEPQTTSLDCRILLVEDGPDNQRLVAFVLRKAGAEVEVADNGRIGVDMVHEAQIAGQPYDVILMDMQMPVMDGYEAAKMLRDEGLPTPIIALTAHAMAGDRQKCLAAGCIDYATKPIDRPKLLATIAKSLSVPSLST